MAAFSPNDVKLTDQENLEADAQEKRINKRLKEEFIQGQTTRIHVGCMHPRILNEIIRRYKAAGWKTVQVSPGLPENLEFNENGI